VSWNIEEVLIVIDNRRITGIYTGEITARPRMT